MKIAICDDCQEDITTLKRLIKENSHCPKYMECYEFYSGKELLNAGQSFDVVFLDIQMKEMDGNVVGEKLRKEDPDVMILFYTGYDMNASQIFKCRPQGYLLKDGNSEELHQSLSAVLKELNDRTARKLAVAGDGQVLVFNLSDILYISIFNKGTKIWITDLAAKRVGILPDKIERPGIKSPTKLDVYYNMLKEAGFLYGSKSYIINAAHVEVRKNGSVQLSDGTELTISRSRKNMFDKEFGHYWSICYNRERTS